MGASAQVPRAELMVPARLLAPPGLTQPQSCPGHLPSPVLPARSPLGQPPHRLQRQGSPCIAPRTPSQAAGTPASSFVYLVSLQLKKKDTERLRTC